MGNNKIPQTAMRFLPDKVNLNSQNIEKLKSELYGDEEADEVGICKKVNQMYRSWIISTVILKYVFPFVSGVIMVLLGIIINKLFGG